MQIETRVDRLGRFMRLATCTACVVTGAVTKPALLAQTRSVPAAPITDSARSKNVARRSPGRIVGIFDAESSMPIDGAEVVDLFVDDVYRTGPSGLLGLWALHQRHDSVAIRVRKLGYVDTAFALLVGAGDTVPVSVFLRRLVALPAVITDAIANRARTRNLAEFEERMHDRSLSGRFLTQADLDKQPSRPLDEVIRDLTAGKARGCNVPPRLFIDGVRAPMEGADTLGRRAADYEGIEFYTPAAAPLRFGGTLDATTGSAGTMEPQQTHAAGTVAGSAAPKGSPSSLRASSSCGVVLLWRREIP